MKTLAMSPNDYSNYYKDPQEFVDSFFEVIELSSKGSGDAAKQSALDSEIDDQAFSTLKSHSANLLKVYVKYIDGSLAEIV
jgi:hypothetical protein